MAGSSRWIGRTKYAQRAQLWEDIHFLRDQYYTVKGLAEGWDLLDEEKKERFMAELKQRQDWYKRQFEDSIEGLLALRAELILYYNTYAILLSLPRFSNAHFSIN
jgi:hypothetical protein